MSRNVFYGFLLATTKKLHIIPHSKSSFGYPTLLRKTTSRLAKQRLSQRRSSQWDLTRILGMPMIRKLLK